jgi:hypothetical protein
MVFLFTRKRGCNDQLAINYNPSVNINDKSTCIYPIKGCMDPKFINYNKYATVSCNRDCSHCIPYNERMNDIYQDKVDCKYCINTKNYKGTGSCTNKQRCKRIIKGCTHPWAYNYNKSANKDDRSCISNEFLENILAIMSSQKRATVAINGKLILDNDKWGFSIILFNRQLNIKDIRSFDTEHDYEELFRMTLYMKNIPKDYIIIIVSRGRAFRLFRLGDIRTKTLKDQFIKFGSKINQLLRNYDNEYYQYIFIGSKMKDIYFEEYSDKTVFFPYLEIYDQECYTNPANIFPPTSYTFFQESVYMDETKRRCALEAIKKGYTKFGLTNNHCIPISDDDYKNKINSMSSDYKCTDGLGSQEGISIYKFKKRMSNDINLTNIDPNDEYGGIFVFDQNNFKGKKTVINTGIDTSLEEHDILGTIKSIIIPRTYMVYIVDQLANLFTLTGPNKFTNLQEIESGVRGITELVVTRINNKSVVFCDELGKDSKCLIFNPGKHRLLPFQFLKIKVVRLSPFTKEVTLYDDMAFSSVIQRINADDVDGNVVMVEMPKIIRSVSIT